MSSIDLATTVSGDIYFEQATQNSQLKLSFDLAFDDKEPLILSFKHIKYTLPDINENSLKLSFEDAPKRETYKAYALTGEDELKNRIVQAIRTTVTDLKTNTDFGSDLELYMHKNLRSKTLISDLESVVSAALSGMVDAMSIEITPTIKTSGDGYFQGVTIRIYSYGNLVAVYTL